MSSRLHFGILGTGNIARQFMAGMRDSRRAQAVAIGSRALDSARAFATAHCPEARIGDYQSVLDDPQVEVVYNALPNSLHKEWSIKAMQAGKHVLCEKPLAVNTAEAEEMFDVSERTGRVLVEAFMYRSHPQTLAVLELVRSGALGEIRLVRSSFCFRTHRVADNIRFRPELGGGALMDIGCYCLDFARLIAQAEPAEASAYARLHPSGIDEVTVGMLRFASGMVSSFTCGVGAQADNAAYVCGTEGYIEIPVPWKPPVNGAVHTIARNAPPRMEGGHAAAPPPRELRTIDGGRDLYSFEIDDFAAAVQDGAPPRLTRADSIGNMKLLDQLRRQVGVKFRETAYAHG